MLGRDKIVEVEKMLHYNGIYDKLEAEWIVTLALSKNRISEVYNIELSEEDESEVCRIVNERIQGKPLSYIVGNTDFYGRNFVVNENVLIPRPETELLVEKVIDEIKKRGSGVKVLDLCSGSGAIGITIALETDAKVSCSDVSVGAISVTKQNAIKLQASIDSIQSDLFNDIHDKFDIIVSNPPYIKSKDMEQLDKEVKDFEPHLALDGGETGVEFYEKIVADAPKYLNPNGMLFFEIGMGQGQHVKSLMNKDFENVQVLNDYNKIDRMIIGNLR